MAKNKTESKIEDQETGIERPRQNFMDLLGANSRGLDAMADRLSDILFNKEKLLMTSRLSKEYALMIIRNSIVSKFFIGYYGNCDAKIEIEAISVPPYYRRKKNKEVIPNDQRVLKNIMAELNEELLQITIAFDGEGRRELTDIVKAVVGKSNEDQRKLGVI